MSSSKQNQDNTPFQSSKSESDTEKIGYECVAGEIVYFELGSLRIYPDGRREAIPDNEVKNLVIDAEVLEKIGIIKPQSPFDNFRALTQKLLAVRKDELESK